MKQKLKVGVLFGGRSAEHEISLLSAKNVIAALDKNKYDVVLIGIDKSGAWYLRDAERFLVNESDPKRIHLNTPKECVTLVPREDGKQLVGLSQHFSAPLDVIFPVLHGPYGEDGTIQGLLKLADIPFVGAGVLGSSIGMDKDIMKRLLRDAGIPIAKFMTVTRSQRKNLQLAAVQKELGFPLFIKPANLGSSVGITKVQHEREWESALDAAFLYDHKILIEEFIPGREIECSVLGNENPIASLPGEIIPQHEFYSYESKYLDENGALFEIPVKLEKFLIQKIQNLAIQTCLTLCCEGMARVDFFLQENGSVYVNELNTIPGFTKISMYPKLWEASGLSQPELLDRLIELAIERFQREKRLKTTFGPPHTENTLKNLMKKQSVSGKT